ncbi:MAG TPA: type I glyceraldehyde-3-phosphate dehydrogenase [Egibacteraceae bacterium]|jgi:glyceraldehyde 3-phosphate dehydrogenase|nr:type I glyceraldehyde-3-phosphate dehydrogenase [Egibacteraceae bacterium]
MATRVAINGFGRIGRQVLRQVADDDDVVVVAVNSGRGRPSSLAQLFFYDSVYGRFPGQVAHDDGHLVVQGRPVAVLTERDPARLPWAAMGVDVVVEATGSFNNLEGACAHLDAGARKVLITAPAARVPLTAVVGVNDDRYDPETHHVISAASCTTNCLAPMVKVLHEAFGVVGGLVTTIHAFTRDQEIHDAIHDDPRRGRAASMNMTPTRTGAAKAIGKVLPELAGSLVGIAVRVPVPDVSLTDLSVLLARPTTAEEINAVFTAASADPAWAGVLNVSGEPLVSCDYVGDRHSCTVDLDSTRGASGNQFKVLGWYDNEAGYAARVVDLVRMLGGVSTGRAHRNAVADAHAGRRVVALAPAAG